MAIKRNSHVYIEEAASIQEAQLVPTMSSTHRSRRGSRSTSKDDASEETDDVQRTNTTGGGAASSPVLTNTLPNDSSTIATAMAKTVGKVDVSATASANAPTTCLSRTAELPQPKNHDRPLNFGIVVPGIYRSSYPKPEDFGFLGNLRLKTIVTLVKKDEPDHELGAFVLKNGIRQVVFNIKGTKKEAIPVETMKAILRLVGDQRNHPLLMHCNHGKHRTGCVVAAMRKVSGWNLRKALDEYESYAAPKIRECDVAYITEFQAALYADVKREVTQGRSLRNRTFHRVLTFVAFVMTLWCISGYHMASTSTQDRLGR
ncbi:hypothetical protein S40285_01761 [Stachybotrys chlorohalonatus IBT 40285]|uniref:diphosphoinositol-polyphosphate diphosphatase n=1 Tax=Stachybotrys chlorohalonatus (strain IBT 40285) TaxID=1283841 RepID=A0A084R289_STAC4|nr:hypothetical protein S40285_01761 [Stachybotrys chlorohalonata IBT 40285]